MRVEGERVMGVAASLLGLAAISETLRLPVQTLTGGPGLRLLPLLLGSLVAVLGAAVAVRRGGDSAETRTSDPGARLRVWGTLLGLVAYALAFERLGFVVTTLVFLALFLVGFGERRWFVVAPVALGATGLTYAVFAGWLKVPLPPGILGY